MLDVIELNKHIINIERCDCSPGSQVISPRFLFRILDQLEILAQEEAGGNYPGSVVSLFKYKHRTIIPAVSPRLLSTPGLGSEQRGPGSSQAGLPLSPGSPGRFHQLTHIFQDCRNLGMSLQTEPLHPGACFANIWLLRGNLPQPEAQVPCWLGWWRLLEKGWSLFPVTSDGLEDTDWNASLYCPFKDSRPVLGSQKPRAAIDMKLGYVFKWAFA